MPAKRKASSDVKPTPGLLSVPVNDDLVALVVADSGTIEPMYSLDDLAERLKLSLRQVKNQLKSVRTAHYAMGSITSVYTWSAWAASDPKTGLGCVQLTSNETGECKHWDYDDLSTIAELHAAVRDVLMKECRGYCDKAGTKPPSPKDCKVTVTMAS